MTRKQPINTLPVPFTERLERSISVKSFQNREAARAYLYGLAHWVLHGWYEVRTRHGIRNSKVGPAIYAHPDDALPAYEAIMAVFSNDAITQYAGEQAESVRRRRNRIRHPSRVPRLRVVRTDETEE